VEAHDAVEEQRGDGVGQVIAPALRVPGELGPGGPVQPAHPVFGPALVDEAVPAELLDRMREQVAGLRAGGHGACGRLVAGDRGAVEQAELGGVLDAPGAVGPQPGSERRNGMCCLAQCALHGTGLGGEARDDELGQQVVPARHVAVQRGHRHADVASHRPQRERSSAFRDELGVRGVENRPQRLLPPACPEGRGGGLG